MSPTLWSQIVTGDRRLPRSANAENVHVTAIKMENSAVETAARGLEKDFVDLQIETVRFLSPRHCVSDRRQPPDHPVIGVEPSCGTPRRTLKEPFEDIAIIPTSLRKLINSEFHLSGRPNWRRSSA